MLPLAENLTDRRERRLPAGLGVVIGFVGLLLSCTEQPAYTCHQDSQCVAPDGTAGKCESNGMCSFSDPTCSGTQRRYANGLSSNCVAVSICASNADCVSTDGGHGVCEANGWCSYFDSSCSTSRRILDGDKNACVPAGSSCIAQLSLGASHSCALRTDGAVYCWGRNDTGQVGDGTQQDRPTPARVAGLPVGRNVVQIAAGELHTCAMMDDNTVWCWGTNDQHILGQCEDATLVSSALPLMVHSWQASVAGSPTCDPTVAFKATSIAAGGVHNCAVGTDGALYCWGENSHGSQGGQCGQDYAVLDPVPGPLKIAGTLTQGVSAVQTGDEYSCVLGTDHSVWCFGSNDLYELGQGGGNATGSYKPLAVQGLADADYLVLADETGCVVTRQKTLFCWGSGSTGIFGKQLTNLDHASYITNGSAAFSGGTAGTICITQSDGSFSCFGANDLGQCGNGTSSPQSTLSPASSATYLATVSKASLGTTHTCAITTDGALWCWGADDHGQLGDGQILGSDMQLVTVPKRIAFPCP
jgi:alpha-tubulin suppressor-like RCC1 family protein